MKKLIALLLAALMVLSMAACSGNNEETEPKAQGPASALEALEKTWALYTEDEKFPAMGGTENVMDAPGAYAMDQKESLSYLLHIPEDKTASITEAATLLHMMNLNTFSCGVVRLADGEDIAAYAKATRDSIQATQWMCGFPGKLLIADMGGQYVLVAFGGDPEDFSLIETFEAKLKEAYSGVNILYSEAIAY